MPRHNRQQPPHKADVHQLKQRSFETTTTTASTAVRSHQPSSPRTPPETTTTTSTTATTTMEEEASSKETSISLLQHLSRACQYHASHHYANNIFIHNSIANPEDAFDALPPRCRKDLITLNTILPKVEQATNEQPSAADIGHLCSFYQDVLVGGYCPHAQHLFLWGKGGTEVLPRIHYLCQHLASRTILQNAVSVANRVKTTHDNSLPVIEPVATIISRTITQLLCFLPDEEPVSKYVCHDLIDLCSDLCVISVAAATTTTTATALGSALFHSQPIQVEILSRTIQASQLSNGTEYLLSVPTLEQLVLLQGAVFSILQDYLEQCRKRRLEDPMTVHGGGGGGQEPVLESVDACFWRILSHGEMLSSLLASIRQVLLSYEFVTDRKGYLLSMKAKVAAGNILLALIEDWEQQDGAPSDVVAMQVRLLVVQSVHAWFCFSVTPSSNHKRANEDSVFRTTLVHLLCHSVLRPIRIHGLQPRHQLEDEGILLCTMLQCIPYWKHDNCGLLELVMLRSIYTGLVTTSHGEHNSSLIEAAWSHCLAHGLLGYLFSLLHSSQKAITNVTLWIFDALLSSCAMVNMERTCAIALNRHQQSPFSEHSSLNAASSPAITTTSAAPAATVLNQVDQSTSLVQDVTNQDNLVTSPTGRKRRRTGSTTGARAMNNRAVEPLPLAVHQSLPKLRSTTSSPFNATSKDGCALREDEAGTLGGNNNGDENTPEDVFYSSLDDALANFLYVALGSASDFVDVVGLKTGGDIPPPNANPEVTSHENLRSRLATVSSAIGIVINGLAKRVRPGQETVLGGCNSILDVLVALCSPVKEVCRMLLVDRSFGDLSLTTLMTEFVSNVGLQAHFALVRVQATDSRLDLLRATWETFSCLALRNWLAAPKSSNFKDEPANEYESTLQSNLPGFCCTGLCQSLLDRVASLDSSKCCTQFSLPSCLCGHCFCFLLGSEDYEDGEAFHSSRRFRSTCSLMLLQNLPLQTRCGMLVCLRPPREGLLSREALNDVSHLANLERHSSGVSLILDVVHATLNSSSLPMPAPDITVVSVLSLSPVLILSLAFQAAQVEVMDRYLTFRTEELLSTHIEQGLAPMLKTCCSSAIHATIQKMIYKHVACIHDLIKLASSEESLDKMMDILQDPEKLLLHLTGREYDGSLILKRNSLILQDARKSLRTALLTLAIKHPDKDLGRLIAFECVHMEGSLRPELKQCLATQGEEHAAYVDNFEGSTEGSSLLWMVRFPFADDDAGYRMVTAQQFGLVLSGNNFNLFFTIFATDDDWIILNQSNDDFGEQESESRKQMRDIAEKVTSRLFLEVDRLLHEFCGITQSQQSVATAFIAAPESTSISKDAKSQEDVASYRLSAVEALSSLCRCPDLSSLCGVQIFEHALLRLIRLWVYNESAGREEETHGDQWPCQGSLASLSFLEISRLLVELPLSNEVLSKFSDHFVPSVFCDLLSPNLLLAGQGIENIPAETRVRHCRLLKTFLETLVEPRDSIVSEDPVTTFQRLFQFVNDWLPSVLAHFVIAQDYECICLTTGFKLFLLGEKRKIEKNSTSDAGQPVGVHGQSFANPAVKVTIRELEEQSKLLCLAPGVIERILPAVFMRSDRDVLVFLTRDVLKEKITLKQIINSREKLILKDLVWEIGRDPDMVTCALRSLRTAAIARVQEAPGPRTRSSSESHVDADEACAVSHWVTSHFMYLLVNVVQYKWKTRTNSERLRALRCLREILAFLPSSESAQYFPQVMATINVATALAPNDNVDRVVVVRIRLVAVQALIQFIGLLVNQQWATVGTNLTDVVVALNPVLTEVPTDSAGEEGWCLNQAKWFAVQLLENLAMGETGKKLLPFFRDIPFLLMSQELEKLRLTLKDNGVDFDGLLPLGGIEEAPRDDHIKGVDSNSMESGNFKDAPTMLPRQAALQGRLNMLLPLLGNENVSIRKAALQHLTDILRINRDVFHNIVENESRTSVLRFLTENYSAADPLRIHGLGRGVVTEIVEILLARCVSEEDEDARILVATCFGEVGAIGEHHLGDIDMASALGADRWQTSRAGSVSNSRSGGDGKSRSKTREVPATENSVTWRLSQPPWQSIAERYELQLLTKHLVVALKAAPTSVDQHMIAFTIQQLLVLLDNSARAGEASAERSIESILFAPPPGAPRRMSYWLTEKLIDAEVLEVIEPYWSSEFSEAEAFVAKQPPFLQTASSFFIWLSNWSRFMVRRSKDRGRNNRWSDFFYACRTALRTQSGVSTAEFLLPLLVLDSVCFGDAEDERVIIQEMKDVLKLEGVKIVMGKADRQRAVDAVFMVIDTLNYWSVNETEARFRTSREAPRASKTGDELSLSSWSAESSVLRIEDIMRAVPLSMQASAAANVGMHARSLRLLEMEARLHVVDRVFNASTGDEADAGYNAAGGSDLSEVDRTLLKDVLGKLNDSDTLIVVAREAFGVDSIERARDSIRQKEATGDWLGALLEYERAQQLNGPEKRDLSLQHGALRCLMELGQFESVLNQVTHARPVEGEVGVATTEHLVPIAVEAAWRLGRWSALADLVEMNPHDYQNQEDNENSFQATLGKAMLGMHAKNFGVVQSALKDARHAAMKDLSSVAKESYDRSYPHIVKLHCLREIENASEVLCKESSQNFSNLSSVAESSTRDGWDWERRLELLSNDGSTAVINTRLALARLARDEELEGSLFLRLGKRARKGGLLSMAANSFAQAEAIFDRLNIKASLSSVRMQLAKLKYESGDITAAMKLLGQDDRVKLNGADTAMLTIGNAGCRNSPPGRTIEFGDARCILKSTRWMVDGGLKGSGEIMRRFRIIQKISPDWEKGHFQLAKYVDSVTQSRITALVARSSQQFSPGMDEDAQRGAVILCDQASQQYVLNAMQHYAKALALDSKHVYLALPRLLSLWFEFTGIQGKEVEIELKSTNKTPKAADLIQLSQRQSEANTFMATHHKVIPAQLFYAVIPQLVSRIIHPNEDTSLVVQRTLKRVLTKFPATAMWPLAWLRQSRNPDRLKIGEELFSGAQKNLATGGNVKMQKLLGASKSLFKYLLDLAKYSPPAQQGNLFTLMPWKGEVDLVDFIPPLQAALSICINSDKDGQSRDFFPRHVPRMRSFASQVHCMTSKAKPKRLKAYAVPGGNQRPPRNELISGKDSRAGDIGEIHFLVKQEAKGDLRKDARVQDLNNVINRLIATGTNNTRQRRRLHLRTFAVTCLSEDTGVIEWCRNTSSLRTLVANAYNPQASPYSSRRRGRRAANLADATLRSNFEERCQGAFFKNGRLAQAATLFDELCLKPYPPVLYWWFVQNFQDPHAWYEARNRFVLTAAVWSVVGHVAIALGDRHAENILVDTTSGDCVHVDFDCIFDKGITLPKPEIVPFRLTHNIVDAFGPTGADGVFSGGLRTALTTLRNNRDTLLSVLEPFVKDPVIEWKKTRRNAGAESSSVRDATQAKRSLKVIDERLRGIYNLRNPNLRKIRRTDGVQDDQDDETSHFLPLSVEGQVHKMIAEATSSENLVQLYVGWMPWI